VGLRRPAIGENAPGHPLKRQNPGPAFRTPSGLAVESGPPQAPNRPRTRSPKGARPRILAVTGASVARIFRDPPHQRRS